MDEYDTISEWYSTTRDGDIGVPELSELSRTLPVGSRILDLGCGNGIPMSRFLSGRGFEVFGIDSSEQMIARFRRNCLDAHAQCARIQDSDFFQTRFDAVVAWGVLFHLSASDQELTIVKVAHALRALGKFLFTAGEREGTVESEMQGLRFSYVSLGAEKYRTLLDGHGFDVLDEHSDAWDNYVFIAEKRA